jgi:hypothetical protein
LATSLKGRIERQHLVVGESPPTPSPASQADDPLTSDTISHQPLPSTLTSSGLRRPLAPGMVRRLIGAAGALLVGSYPLDHMESIHTVFLLFLMLVDSIRGILIFPHCCVFFKI